MTTRRATSKGAEKDEQEKNRIAEYAMLDDKQHLEFELIPGWVESFGYWVGGAERLTLRRTSDGWEVSSRERCSDHGCGRICYVKIGTLDEILDYAERLSETHHPAMREQVARNIARLRGMMGGDHAR